MSSTSFLMMWSLWKLCLVSWVGNGLTVCQFLYRCSKSIDLLSCQRVMGEARVACVWICDERWWTGGWIWNTIHFAVLSTSSAISYAEWMNEWMISSSISRHACMPWSAWIPEVLLLSVYGLAQRRLQWLAWAHLAFTPCRTKPWMRRARMIGD